VKVCIDIQAAIAQRAGVGRYTKLLVEHLGPLAGADELGLFYFDFKRNGSPFPVTNAQERAVRWIPGRYVQQAWKRVGWPPFDAFSGPADLFHFPNFVRPPLRKGKSVVTIHDVSFLRYPETMEAKNYAFLSSQIQQTVERSDAIITDSRFVANEIHTLLKVPREKLFPIHLGLSSLAPSSADALAAFKTSFGLAKPYLLHVGTIEPRKNHLFLIELFEQLDGFDGELVLAGMKGWKCEPIFERIRQSPAADRIRYIDYIPDEHLADLYSGAEALVFPSLYEGFGFPPLEAMLCGTPVIASTAGSLAEVLGDGACMVADYDIDAWKSAVAGVLGDPQPWIAAGGAKAATYNWSTTARETWDLYRKVAG
jgi:glycosyltransferase involved in cell wall biosynthesis